MKEMLSNWRNEKLRKKYTYRSANSGLNKEEMEIKREMLKKMELQDQQFSHSVEAFQENMSNFTNILSQSVLMMTASFNFSPFLYQQVNHYRAAYQQQTESSTQNLADVRKVNHYQDPYFQ